MCSYATKHQCQATIAGPSGTEDIHFTAPSCDWWLVGPKLNIKPLDKIKKI